MQKVTCVNPFSNLKRSSIDVFHDFANPISVGHLCPHHIELMSHYSLPNYMPSESV